MTSTSTRYSCDLTWKEIGIEMELEDYWVNQREIPLGTLEPFESYVGEIPDEDIVTIPFDPVDIPFTQRKAQNILCLAGSGDGKCVEETQKVLLPDGSHVMLKDLPETGIVVSMNQGTLKLEPKPYILRKNKEKKECYRITTQFGSEIIASGNHPFLTNKSEWTQVLNLKVGQFIATARDIPYFGQSYMSDGTIKILAYLIADGCINYHIGYTKKDMALVNDFSAALQEYRCQLLPKNGHKYNYSITMDYKKWVHEKNPIRSLCEIYGLYGQKSPQRTIPDAIFSLPKESIALFLNRLFSGDGCIYRNRNRDKFRYCIQYSSGNKEMCIQIGHLLRRFGILARIYAKHNKEYNRDYYYVEMQNAPFVKRFIDEIGFYGEKHDRAMSWYGDISSINTNTNFDLTPILKKKRFLGRERAKKYDQDLAESDLFWDRIRSIEEVGLKTTYDLQVKDNENFICNDFISHNSLMMKTAWTVLAKAGYYIVYIDRKSLDAARAKKPWHSNRLPKYMYPEGIPLRHYMPAFNTIDDYEHMVHNFEVYDWNLRQISERDMLRGLGMSLIAASHFNEMISENPGITVEDLKDYIKDCVEGRMNSTLDKSSLRNAQRVLLNLEYFQMIQNKYKKFDLLREFRRDEKVRSLVISYNNTDDKNLLTFDIGLKIKQASRLSTRNDHNTPIFFFLDDASDYGQEHKAVEYSFSVEQVKKIGFDYRSKGVYNWLSIQSLGVIDEDVAEGYPTKIVSPYFKNPESLTKVNIPKKAIKYLKDNMLVRNKESHLVQWILITEDNKVVPFYPFTPPCNHFTEVYKAREVKK